jgi:hypothetical protein
MLTPAREQVTDAVARLLSARSLPFHVVAGSVFGHSRDHARAAPGRYQPPDPLLAFLDDLCLFRPCYRQIPTSARTVRAHVGTITRSEQSAVGATAAGCLRCLSAVQGQLSAQRARTEPQPAPFGSAGPPAVAGMGVRDDGFRYRT